MLKAPREGEVKTRLALAIGTAEAARVYRHLVEHQIGQIPRDWRTSIHFTPADAADEMRTWLGTVHGYWPQPDGDLGSRLNSAMHSHFAISCAPLVFLGGDCPYLTTARLLEANKLLRESDASAVLVPALDGGYCLLGLRRPLERVFSAIPWGTAAVADETRQRLREERIPWKELQPLEDVDDEMSWARAKVAFPDLEM